MAYHRYTVTNLNRPTESVTVYWRLGLAAAFFGTLLSYLVTLIHKLIPELALVSIPVSTALIYIGLASLTSSYLWRWTWSRLLLGINTPKVGGAYVATVAKTRGYQESTDYGELVIKQKWRTMSIVVKTANGISHSTSSALIVSAGVRLEHQYYVSPIKRPGNKVVAHQGAAFTDFPEDKCDMAKQLTLSYFTEHGETGIITLVRKND
jgi:hypothetical protein